MKNINSEIRQQTKKLAEEYNQGTITHDEVRDVLMGNRTFARNGL